MGRKDGREVKGTEGESGTRYVTLRKDYYCCTCCSEPKEKRRRRRREVEEGVGEQEEKEDEKKKYRWLSDGERVKIQVQKSISLARANIRS